MRLGAAALGGTTVQDLGYGYDVKSNVTSIADARVPARGQSFQYDALDRLTQATGVYQQLDYTYDGMDNRLTRTRTGTGAYAETLAYGTTGNGLETVTRGADVRSLSYAASGQVANDNRGATAVYGFTINARGRVGEAQLLGQPVAQYGYNALEQRVGAATDKTKN